ncbi:MAG: TonB-dependent siderophore receptor [Sneathiella sp.]
MFFKYLCATGVALSAMMCLDTKIVRSDEVIEIDPIIVKGTRMIETPAGPVDGYVAPTADGATRTRTPIQEIPQSISVIPRTVLNDQQSLGVSESLRNVSGVQANNQLSTPASDSTRIRGFGAEQLLDGFTQYYNPADRESIVGTERVEVLKGANGVLYGGGSGTPVGGVVNIVSRKPEAEAFAEAGIKLGTDQLVQPYFDINQPLNEKVLLRLSGEYTNTDSHVDVVETERYNLNPSVTFTDNDGLNLTVIGKLSRWSQPEYQGLPATGTVAGGFSIDRDLFVGPTDMPDSKSKFDALTLIFENRLDDDLKFDIRARLAQSEFDEKAQTLVGADGFSADAPALGASTWSLVDAHLFQEQTEKSIQANIEADFNGEVLSNTLLVGADFSKFEDKGFIDTNLAGGGSGVVDLTNLAFPAYSTPGPGVNNQFVDNTTYGAYAQLQTTLYKKLHILSAVRAAVVKVDFKNTSTGVSAKTDTVRLLPRLGVSYDMTDDLSVFAGYAEGMRGQPFSNFVSSPEPERSRQIEAGLKFNYSNALTGQVSFYQIDRSNVAVTDNTDPLFRSVAKGEQRSRGAEFDIVWQPTRSLRMLANYAFADAEFTNSLFGVPTGNKLPVVPRHSGRAWINYQFTEAWSGGLGIYAQSESYLSNNNNFKADAFYTMDAALSYEQDNYRIAGSVKNLTDQEYFEAYNYFGGRVAPSKGIAFAITASIFY